MSTKSPNPILAAALANVPSTFRSRLIHTYLDLKKNCAEARYEPAGLAAGKFCEVVLRFLQEKVHGSFTPFGTKINNYADECRKLIMAPNTAGNESERVMLPRALVFLYTMRSKRGIGHVGGDVDANAIDIAAMAKTADWIVCELVRINHGLSLEEAQDIVDGISVRQLPAIWEVAGKKRVLKDGLKAKDQALLLLYSNQNSAVLLEDLCEWVEYCNPRMFKNVIIRELHKKRFLEFDKDSESIILSPKGVEYVEKELI
ncbi:MAG: hypothetical protein A3H28_10920 [Acidobacteria bacterium RIFCSPLOWO2_02_FULL_61_28]|nr:MAG: hypothetical protein A3H28_10920 [Acidobacteria bacterium RIFCSPLOWO2_02_FULL_61_28]